MNIYVTRLKSSIDSNIEDFKRVTYKESTRRHSQIIQFANNIRVDSLYLVISIFHHDILCESIHFF